MRSGPTSTVGLRRAGEVRIGKGVEIGAVDGGSREDAETHRKKEGVGG